MRSRNFRIRAGRVVSALALGLLAWGAPRPEQPAIGGPAPGRPGLREVDDETLKKLLELPHTQVERVRLVLLPTKVEDRRGRLVRGLTRDDFRVFEDQVPQEIRYFSVEMEQPVSIAFLLDVSGSMRELGKLDEAKEAIRFFVSTLRPKDELSLICFADEQVSQVTEFTGDRERFLERLGVQEGFGQTALNDAVAAAPGLVQLDGDGKKAIVLITDGVDNASRLTVAQALDLARRVDVPIYTIGFSTIPEPLLKKVKRTNLEVLARISAETGGSLFIVRDPDDLKEAVVRIFEELRFQYVIGYHPSRTSWDGGFRTVRLETRRRGLEIRTRKGYYAVP